MHIQVYSVHIDAQLHCQWFLLFAVLRPLFFLLSMSVVGPLEKNPKKTEQQWTFLHTYLLTSDTFRKIPWSQVPLSGAQVQHALSVVMLNVDRPQLICIPENGLQFIHHWCTETVRCPRGPPDKRLCSILSECRTWNRNWRNVTCDCGTMYKCNVYYGRGQKVKPGTCSADLSRHLPQQTINHSPTTPWHQPIEALISHTHHIHYSHLPMLDAEVLTPAIIIIKREEHIYPTILLCYNPRGGFMTFLQVRCNANCEIPHWWISLQKVMKPPVTQ